MIFPAGQADDKGIPPSGLSDVVQRTPPEKAPQPSGRAALASVGRRCSSLAMRSGIAAVAAPCPPAQSRPARSRDFLNRLLELTSLAEAFLRAGVANYIGTHWPVVDSAAADFARSALQ